MGNGAQEKDFNIKVYTIFQSLLKIKIEITILPIFKCMLFLTLIYKSANRSLHTLFLERYYLLPNDKLLAILEINIILS